MPYKNPEIAKQKKKEYYSRPEVKERMKLYSKSARVKKARKLREATLEFKSKRKKYRNTPDQKAKEKSYKQTDSYKKKQAEYMKEYRRRPEVISKRNQLFKEKLKASPNFKLRIYISNSIRQSIKFNNLVKDKPWCKLVNFTLQDLMEHLEKQFVDGMTWENYGSWHIDHIKPVSSFNFQTIDDQQFKECWSLTNLQPLWAIDNIRKSNKLTS